jgi:hypothetical protein
MSAKSTQVCRIPHNYICVSDFRHARRILTLYVLRKPCVLNWHACALVGS